MVNLIYHVVFLCLFVISAVSCQNISKVHSGEGWGLARIDLELTLSPDLSLIQGKGKAVLHLLEEGSYGPTLRLDEGRQRFLSVSHPAQPNIALHRNEARASIRFQKPFSKGDSISVSFQYVIEESSPSDYPIHFLLDSSAIFAAFGYNWHPQPISANGGGDKVATGTLQLNMPSSWKSDSQGVLTSTYDDGNQSIEVWRTDTPVPRRFAAGPYRLIEVDGKTKARFLFHQISEEEGKTYILQLQSILNYLETWFGPNPLPKRDSLGYDPGRGIAIIEVPDKVGFGARNEMGAILVPTAMLCVGNNPARLNEWILVHELAHMWWGGGVRAENPGLMMIHEGLPGYAEVLLIEAKEGVEAAREFMQFSRPLPNGFPAFSAKGYFELWREGHDVPLMSNNSENDSQRYLPAKSKGIWVWHMLRQRIGDEAFFRVLKNLIQKNQDANTRISLSDIREVYLEQTKDADLEDFFSEWLDRLGAPILTSDWKTLNGNSIELIIEQKSQTYSLPMEVGLVTSTDTVIHQINLKEAKEKFIISVDETIEEIILDPAHKLLIWRPDYGPIPKL